MIYPGTVQIETTTACNAHCGFCPHSTMNAKGKMNRELISKIIDEIASWNRPIQICPFLTNEPFADVRIFDVMKEINSKIPKAIITIFTNASLLNQVRLSMLSQVQNIESVHCSVHHTTQHEYQKELGLDLGTTVENIRGLLWTSPKFPVYVLKVSNGVPAKDAEFVAFCSEHFPGAKPYVATRWNWKGDISSHDPPMLDMICPRHTSMCILHDGRVALCCMDQSGDYCLGDVNHQSLLDIYNGAIRAKFANSLKRANDPCNKCNMR